MIQPGRYDQRVAFQRLIVAPDAMGSVIETWSDLFTAWGKVTGIKGAESVDSGQRVSGAEFTFEVRSDSRTKELTPKDRISWNGLVCDVSEIIPIPAGRPEHFTIRAMGRAA